MEQFVVQFPAAAAWLIVAGGGLFCTIATLGGHLFLKRMDKRDKDLDARLDRQDAAIASIPAAVSGEIRVLRELVEHEIKELRDGQHRLANRVVSIEAFNKARFAFEHPSALNAPNPEGRIP